LHSKTFLDEQSGKKVGLLDAMKDAGGDVLLASIEPF
jgi:hypothetical protein